MSETTRGIPVEIDGRPLFLKFDFNAIVALEEALRTPEINFGNLGFRGQRALVWAGLLHEKNAPTLAEVGDWLSPVLKDPKRYTEVMTVAVKAYADTFPEDPKVAEPGV